VSALCLLLRYEVVVNFTYSSFIRSANIVFWNRFAEELYQYTREEALGKNVMDVTPSDVTQELGAQIFGKLAKGEHWKGFFGVQRKDSTQFIAHVTDTPVLDSEGNLKFIVGVSADYSQMHNLMKELKSLNANLEKEVDDRTKELMEREKTLRMIGAAVKESDTGVFITEDDRRIIWSNDAVSRMFDLPEKDLLKMLPWDLPIEPFFNGDAGKPDLPNLKELFEKMSGTFSVSFKMSEDIVKIMAVTVQSMSDSNSKQRMFILRDLTAEYEAATAKRAAERAAAASQTKTEMMHMLSHVSIWCE